MSLNCIEPYTAALPVVTLSLSFRLHRRSLTSRGYSGYLDQTGEKLKHYSFLASGMNGLWV